MLGPTLLHTHKYNGYTNASSNFCKGFLYLRSATCLPKTKEFSRHLVAIDAKTSQEAVYINLIMNYTNYTSLVCASNELLEKWKI